MIRCLVAIAVLAVAGCDNPAATGLSSSPQVLMFSASWCAPCQVAKKELKNRPLRVPVTVIDVDVDPATANRYHVRALPTFVVVQRGRVVVRTSDVNVVVQRYGRSSQRVRTRH